MRMIAAFLACTLLRHCPRIYPCSPTTSRGSNDQKNFPGTSLLVAPLTSPSFLMTVVPAPPAPRLPGPTPPPCASPDVPPAPGVPSHTPRALVPHTLSRASTG